MTIERPISLVELCGKSFIGGLELSEEEGTLTKAIRVKVLTVAGAQLHDSSAKHGRIITTSHTSTDRKRVANYKFLHGGSFGRRYHRRRRKSDSNSIMDRGEGTRLDRSID